MFIDNLDFFIIERIYFAKDETTTWKITKDFFKDIKLDSKKGWRELEKKHQTVKNRLKKMKRWGVVKIDKDKKGHNIYTLMMDKVKISKMKFPDREYHKAIFLNIEKIWNIFQI